MYFISDNKTILLNSIAFFRKLWVCKYDMNNRFNIT